MGFFSQMLGLARVDRGLLLKRLDWLARHGAPLPRLLARREGVREDPFNSMLLAAIERMGRPDKSERRLRALLAALPVPLLVVSRPGLITVMNAAGMAQFGEMEHIGTSIYDLLPRDMLGPYLAGDATADVDLPGMDGRLYRLRLVPLGAEADDATAIILREEPGDTVPALLDDFGLHDLPPAAPAPTLDTPLDALPALVLDTETTGLDVRKERIVSIGGIPMLGTRRFPAASFDRLINPGIPIPPGSTQIHGIADHMVTDAPPFGDVWPEIAQALEGRVLIGFNTGFDAALIKRELDLLGIDWTPPIILDLRLMADGADIVRDNPDLETLAQRLGVDPGGRHTALGDALVTADVFAAMIPTLRERNIVTLNDARYAMMAPKRRVQALDYAGWLR